MNNRHLDHVEDELEQISGQIKMQKCVCDLRDEFVFQSM